MPTLTWSSTQRSGSQTPVAVWATKNPGTSANIVWYLAGTPSGVGTYTCIATGCGCIQMKRAAYPRPALGSIGGGFLKAGGSSVKGFDSREPLVPGGTTTNGPVGFGRTTNTGP